VCAGLFVSAGAIFAACDGENGSAVETPTPRAGTGTIAVTPTASAEPSTTGAPSPTNEPQAPIVLSRGNPQRREIALTFDAGSDAGYTSQVLATLRDENIRASFAVTGLWAEANPDLLLSIATNGHVLMNHTYDHRSFTGRSSGEPPLTRDERALELSRVETTVYRLTSRTTRPYFRPPFGDVDPRVEEDAASAGFGVIVMWTIDTLGWDGATAGEIVRRTLSMAEAGAIVIMHVGSESQDAAALPDVIRGLRDDGYAFVTIPEMVAAR
jgi:peptidoglycan/xylan/chitin deacetylase (PgdA/CDA1 family)